MSTDTRNSVHLPPRPWGAMTPTHDTWADAAVGSQAPREGHVSVVGMVSDEGVRRNHGRTGAALGPDAIRRQLGRWWYHHQTPVTDLGDVVVLGEDLESAQALLGEVLAPAIQNGLTIVLGGGHETAYGTYLGLRAAKVVAGERRLTIINFDAHFDLRPDRPGTSGTPFSQMAEELGQDFRYHVVGVSRPNNSPQLFQEAHRRGVRYLLDEECDQAGVRDFLVEALDEADDVHLTIDLDCLPSGTAPGVSAPAGFGLRLPYLLAGIRQVIASGKVRVVDVVELNPTLDIDRRTARVASRVVDTVVAAHDAYQRR